MRIGTRYRLESFRASHMRWEKSELPLLDVGCFEGEFLDAFGEGSLIGVDVVPRVVAEEVRFVQADGQRLPFRSGSLGQAVALDVIEHLPDGAALVQEMLRVTAAGGRILVTTPSSRIRLFPPFLTGWISAHWGHIDRRGYSDPELLAMSEPVSNVSCTVHQWNAPAFRLWYLFMRALDTVWPAGAGFLLDVAARWDASHRDGDRGFLWMVCRREVT